MQKSVNKYRMNAENPNSFDDLQKFGRFQLLQYILICLPLITVSMLQLNYIFVAEDVNHRCRIPECDSYNATVDIPDYWPEDIDAKCFRPVMIEGTNGFCSNDTSSGLMETCDEWIYEHNNSIVSELNLGCQLWKPMLVGSVHNAGMVFSMSIAGWIADRFGRKLSMILCSVGGAVGLFKIFLTNYYGYLAIEFLETVLASGLYTVGIVIMIEVGGESKRVSTGVIFCYAFYTGEILFALIAMGLKYWKYIVIAVYAPMFLFIFYIFMLRESMRWQIINEKVEEVKETLKVIARVNNLSVTEEEITEITPEELSKKFNAVVQKETESMKHIIASKEMLIRLAVSSFCFFTSGLTYYGMAVHSVLLPGNKYVNFILSALVSFPSDLVALFLMKRFGRKKTLQCGYICLSVFLVASSFSPESMSVLKLVLFLVGKLGTVVCFTSTYTYGLELFPTSVRGRLFGTGNTAARVGSMLAPVTLLLTTTSAALPSILFAASAILSAFLLIFTPETKTMPMFDTIAQVDHYIKKNLENAERRQGTDNFSYEISENI